MNKKTIFVTLALACASMTFFNSCSSCGKGGDSDSLSADSTAKMADADVPTKEIKIAEGAFNHTYLVADQTDEAHIYKQTVDKSKAFIVISKKEYRLYVYEAVAGDTVLAASFPCCYAINAEAKEKEGDNKTPECSMSNPFTVSSLDNASTWCFDFQDGRGPIKAFGNWFIRLSLANSFPNNPALAANRSVGIHGSTGNERSIPGRDSHGCIRLYDNELNILHDNYVTTGTKVIVKGIKEGKLPFEVAAQQKLGNKYVAPTKGYTDKFTGKAPTAESAPATAPAASASASQGATSPAPAATPQKAPATKGATSPAPTAAATKPAAAKPAAAKPAAAKPAATKPAVNAQTGASTKK